jgi:hypothetical protein
MPSKLGMAPGQAGYLNPVMWFFTYNRRPNTSYKSF